MANTGFLSVSELSFDGIKDNLKTFLKSKTQFKDYDFEGSNLNMVLDLLSYNTYMNSFYLNMVGSEMFLDSSQLTASVVSHAKDLNYLPRSRTSARAQVTFTVDTGGATPPYVIIPENYVTKSVVDNVNMDFTTDGALVLIANNGVYTSQPTYIYEGKVVTEYFTVLNGSRFILSSNSVDTNSLKVTVVKSSIDSTNSTYTKAETLYGLNSSSEVYFVNGYGDTQYEIVFGDGISGKSIVPGNIVKIKYRSTNGNLGNNARTFAPTKRLDPGNYKVTVTTNLAAVDGSERESIDSIKFNAPRHYASQNRAVTREDYINLILQKYPQIRSVNVYGGEDADPPQFGKVIVSVVPYGTIPIISTELKNDIISYLSGKNITTQPIIVDPEYLFVEIVTNVNYNPALTTNSVDVIRSKVLSQIQSYDSLYLSDFGNDLRKSKLTTMIDSADPSIVSSSTNLRAIYKIRPVRDINTTYNFSFSNQIDRLYPAVYQPNEIEAVRTNFFSYNKDNIIYNARIADNGKGILQIYYLTPQSQIVVLEDIIGTVDYITGNMSFVIHPWDYTNSINFYARLASDDIIVQQSKYIEIDYEKLQISVNVFKQ